MPPTCTAQASQNWGDVSAVRFSTPAGSQTIDALPEHRVVFYETAGVAAQLRCGDLRRVLTPPPGVFDIIPAGASWTLDYAAPVQLVSLRLTSDLVTATADSLNLRGAVDVAPRFGTHDAFVQQIARAVAAEIDQSGPVGRLYAESLGAALANRLLKNFTATGTPRRRTLSKPQMRRIIALIEAELCEDLSLSRIAQAAQVSVPHLTAMFRRTTGQSVHRYVMERRVERARDLLLEGRLGTAEIASACGFAHQSHLARWTRRVLGATPSGIRGGD